MKVFKSIILSLLLININFGRIWRLPEEIGGSPNSPIQSGIEDPRVAPGDTISVRPGIYYDNIVFRGKNIVLINRTFLEGDSNPLTCIIDGSRHTRGEDSASVITFVNDENESTAVIGFTIQNGGGTLGERDTSVGEDDEPLVVARGGGILCYSSNRPPYYFSTPTIMYNIIRWNKADYGGGIYVRSCDYPVHRVSHINNNIIVENKGRKRGSGIFFAVGYGEIRDNIILRNECVNEDLPFAVFISAEQYFQIHPPSFSIKIINNTIKENISPECRTPLGGGMYIFTGTSNILVKENKIYKNSPSGLVGFTEAPWAYPPNLGDISQTGLGLNYLDKNRDFDLINFCYDVWFDIFAQGNYWGTLDKDTLRKKICIWSLAQGIFIGKGAYFDPIAASDKYFSVTYPSYCSTDVIVTGDFTINSNASLNIKEGKTFYFTEKDDVAGGIASNLSELIIKGSINAYGNERDSIKFIPYPYSEPIQLPIWYGIRVLENGRGNFTYCKIRGGFIGIYASSADLLNIQTSKITDNELAGVYCENTSPSISDCDFINNGVYGIYLKSSVPVSPGIYHNNISLWHRYGIYWDAPPSLSAHITGNVIKDYSSPPYPSLYGIYLTCGYQPSVETLKISDNRIESFSQGGICVQNFSPVEIIGNKILSNNIHYGDGIYSTLNSRPIIRWTIIDSFKAGVRADYNSYPDLGIINYWGNNQILLGNYYWVVNHNPEPQEPIYAQYNWWGTARPDTLPWKFIGRVIYDPWLISPPWEEEFTSSQVSNLNKITSPVLNISPNIIKDKLNIKYFLPKEEEVSLILYDNNGRKVKLIDKGKKDKNEITLLTKDLNNGLYFLIFRGKDFNLKRKLIILK